MADPDFWEKRLNAPGFWDQALLGDPEPAEPAPAPPPPAPQPEPPPAALENPPAPEKPPEPEKPGREPEPPRLPERPKPARAPRAALPPPPAPAPARVTRAVPAPEPDRRKPGRFRASGVSRTLELANVFRCLSFMLASGIPIVRGLDVLSRTTPDAALGLSLGRAMKQVESGDTIAGALAREKGVFGDLVLQMVHVGEQSGSLPQILQALSHALERQAHMARQVRQALTYPAFLFVACLGVVVLIPTLLMDGMFAFLSDLHATIPSSTRALMMVGSLARSPWTWLGLAGGLWGAGVLYRLALREPALRDRHDRALLKLWLVGPGLRDYQLARFTLALQTTYACGMPLLAALRTCANATENCVVRRAAQQAADLVMGGDTLPQALAATRLFPGLHLAVLTASEEAGRMAQGLGEVSRMAEQQLEYRLALAMAALEPIMLWVMGCLVGGIVVATLSPLLRVMESLAL